MKYVGGKMNFKESDKTYDIEIIKKRTTKNTYIRVKDDLTIQVTTNIHTSDRTIKNLIENNKSSIIKMIDKIKKKNEYNSKFYYLGKQYDIIYTNSNKIEFGNDKVFIGKNIDINKFMKKQASHLFKERLDYWYNRYTKKIPYPSLTIRTMKTRWGVCNVVDKRVTLNLELMKKDPICLDYVIVHELTHLIHANHSNEFWNLVEENFKDCKKIRKILKEY